MNLFCLEFVWPILLIEFRTVFLNIEKHGSVFSKIVCYYNIKIKECQHTHSFSLSHGNEPFSVSQYQFVYTCSTTLIASVKILAYPIVFLPRTTVLYIFCHFSNQFSFFLVMESHVDFSLLVPKLVARKKGFCVMYRLFIWSDCFSCTIICISICSIIFSSIFIFQSLRFRTTSTGRCSPEFNDNIGFYPSMNATCYPQVDAVYTWVNGSDPKWFQEMQYYRSIYMRSHNLNESERDTSISMNRFRDNDELK